MAINAIANADLPARTAKKRNFACRNLSFGSASQLECFFYSSLLEFSSILNSSKRMKKKGQSFKNLFKNLQI